MTAHIAGYLNPTYNSNLSLFEISLSLNQVLEEPHEGSLLLPVPVFSGFSGKRKHKQRYMKDNRIFSLIDFFVPFGIVLRKQEPDSAFVNWKEVLVRFIPHTWFIFWLTSLIPFAGTLVYGLFLIPISAMKHIHIKKIENKFDRASIFLWYYVVILIGFGGLWSFTGHIFLAERVANGIGWDPGPFQTELAFYTLGSGIAGFLAIWLRGHIITALVISKSVFWFGAAYTHILDAVVNQNYSQMNVGTVLIGDLLYPIILFTLLFYVLRKDVSTAFKSF